jgi:hypothetical protein
VSAVPSVAIAAWLRLLLAVVAGVGVVAILVFAAVFLAGAMAGADAGTSGDYGVVY